MPPPHLRSCSKPKGTNSVGPQGFLHGPRRGGVNTVRRAAAGAAALMIVTQATYHPLRTGGSRDLVGRAGRDRAPLDSEGGLEGFVGKPTGSTASSFPEGRGSKETTVLSRRTSSSHSTRPDGALQIEIFPNSVG